MNDDHFASQDHLEKVKTKLYQHRKLQGERVGIRLDIPSASRGLGVVCIHESESGGKVVGYDHSVTLTNASFIVHKSGQREIGALGKRKRPMAYIGGVLTERVSWLGVRPERIFFDPKRVHLFVDANNSPVRGACVVWMEGSTVWASGLDYWPLSEAPLPPEGMVTEVRGFGDLRSAETNA